MLLDTHVVLWLLSDDARLGPEAREKLLRASERLVSAGSLWELAIKVELGKVRVPDDLPERIDAAGLTFLQVRPAHAWAVRTVTGLQHRDPFDRLLLAQAHMESVPLLTADAAILDADLDPAVSRIDARN